MSRKSTLGSKILKTQRIEVRAIPNHDCGLPVQDEVASYRIYQGLLVLCRRNLWKWMTVNPCNPHSKRYLKSAARIHNEEVRHLDKYPNMIHPFSKFTFMWKMAILFVWSIQFIWIPIVIAKEHYLDVIFYVHMAICVLCHVDIVIRFFTGYYDNTKQVMVMKSRKVAVHYVCTFFLIDLLTSQPWDLYIRLLYGSQYHFVSSIFLLKMVRLPTLIKYLHCLSETTGFATSKMRLMTFTIWITVLLMWTSSVVYMIVLFLHREQLLRRTVKHFPMLMTAFRVTRALMAVGVTDHVNTSNVVMLIEIAGIAVGSVIQIIILAKVMQFYQKRSSSLNKYNRLLEEIGEYMKYKELPVRLRDKIIRYVNFKFQKHIFKEEDILSNLSSVLKHEILLHRCERMIAKVDIFKDLPPHVIVRIVTKLRSEIFLPRDVIVLAGYTGNAMYFIYMGTVAVYTEHGKEICHLDDGSHFGEISLVINEPRVATVVAVKECELYRLSRKDFQEAIEPYPELNKKIRMLALRRLQSTLQMMSENKEESRIFAEKDESYIAGSLSVELDSS